KVQPLQRAHHAGRDPDVPAVPVSRRMARGRGGPRRADPDRGDGGGALHPVPAGGHRQLLHLYIHLLGKRTAGLWGPEYRVGGGHWHRPDRQRGAQNLTQQKIYKKKNGKIFPKSLKKTPPRRPKHHFFFGNESKNHPRRSGRSEERRVGKEKMSRQ